MTQHDPLITLRELIDYCEAAREVLGDMDATQVASSLVVSLALTRALELIGEAARRLPEDFRGKYPDVPWRPMINFRNVMAHAYDRIDYDIAVGVVRIAIPPLLEQLRAILDVETQS